MLGSQFMKGKLRNETKAWETKLNNMSELIEEVSKCQKTWMYLEPIFASDDIHKQMPTEGSYFRDVDNLWKATMEAIDNDPGIIDLVERENIKLSFEDANKKLDKIQKSLNEYLEEKRLIFPRFYFLANEDLLMLLAQTKEPRAVQPHMDKCFEGIYRVMFSDKDEVFGMISAEGEQVEFDKKVDVNEGDKKGNVEKWMLEIEAVMRRSLKGISKESLHAYLKVARITWVRNWPGQIILAVNSIHWTTEVEQAIKEYGKEGLEAYKDKLNKQIEDIVQLVRTDLNVQERITLKALVVIDVHARDVVQELIDKDIKSIYDFDWTAQLRYYWEENDTLRVKMVTAVIDYAYEYLGNSLRLVITPLTDRCYRTLLGAKHLNYGGAPEGPAGTGKTESVKDLAKAVAVQCVVFNCSDGLDYLAMAKFFKGLAASGAWCCFDEFNRIDLEVLSVIAQQILTIQLAIKDVKKRTFIFEGTELKINRACAVNITMNPGYAGRSELPDNLKALFRPCAMMVPDYRLIAEIELYSFGFSEASQLSVKVVASLKLSSEQLSSQDHYDFGMRAVKAILNACGNLRRQLDWPEKFIGLRALNDVNIPKFTSNDIPLFLGITSDLFPGVTLPKPDYAKLLDAMDNVCHKLNLQPKKEFIEKCIQLYDTMMVRHGLMVVGKAFSGKSKVLSVLAKAMSYIKDDPKFVNVLSYYANPKSITQDQLYGKFDMDSGEWSDGVLAIKIRDCAESQSIDRKWIIFDGPVDAVWVENMNTVLDDNKKLCLTSGQIIKLKPTMTIMFEVEDLTQASPATVSRCGMVLMEPKQLGHSPLITSYCNDLEKFLGKTAETIRQYMHYLSDVCVEFTNFQGKFPVPTDPNFLVNSMINMFECYVKDWRSDEVAVKIPKEAEEMCMHAVIFAHLWSIGVALDESSRPKFDLFF
jgi:dynein heavy chain